MLNGTIAENIAHTGGGVYRDALRQATHSASGTRIVALNLVDLGGTGPDVSGDFTSGGHNLIGDGSGSTGFTNGTNGDQVGTAPTPSTRGSARWRNNGGPTQTKALLAGSPAIDTGDNNAIDPISGQPLTTDHAAGPASRA